LVILILRRSQGRWEQYQSTSTNLDNTDDGEFFGLGLNTESTTEGARESTELLGAIWRQAGLNCSFNTNTVAWEMQRRVNSVSVSPIAIPSLTTGVFIDDTPIQLSINDQFVLLVDHPLVGAGLTTLRGFTFVMSS